MPIKTLTYMRDQQSPEILLWRSILLQNMCDAVYDRLKLIRTISQPISIEASSTEQILSRHARIWLNIKNKSFTAVCDYGFINPDAAYENSCAIIKRFDQMVTVIPKLTESFMFRSALRQKMNLEGMQL